MIKKISSIILEAILVISAIVGVTLTVLMGSQGFLYFTVQSNIWIAIICLIFLIYQTISFWNKKYEKIPDFLYKIKFVFTISITLTGLVFCFVLAPTMENAFSSAMNVLTHVVVPLCAIIDLFIKRYQSPKYSLIIYSLIPPIYYLIFALIGYVLNWNFGYGLNYPYFFLNWGSPAGAFGFADGIYFMGTFYWIIAMIAFISLLSFIYVLILKKLAKAKTNN